MIVGTDFLINEGEEVDQEVFASKVGTGWRSLCVSTEVERAVKQPTRVERRRGRA
jgi:hypothetical protein